MLFFNFLIKQINLKKIIFCLLDDKGRVNMNRKDPSRIGTSQTCHMFTMHDLLTLISNDPTGSPRVRSTVNERLSYVQTMAS